MDLSELHEIHGDTLPSFIDQCIEVIKANPVGVKNVFENKELEKMVELINTGYKVEISNSVQAWSILKYFLLSLPYPLLGEVASYMNCGIELLPIQKKLNSLPMENLSLLEKLFGLFNYLSQYHSQLYSKKLLAHTFALFVVYTKGESISTDVYELMEFFITNYQELFHGDFDDFDEMVNGDNDQEQYQRLSSDNGFMVMNKKDDN